MSTQRGLFLRVTAPGGTHYATFYSNGTDAFARVSDDGASGAHVEEYGGGWDRVWLYWKSGAADAGARQIDVGLCLADGTLSYAGNNLSTLYVWGAQLEAGVMPGPGIYTREATASSVVPVYYDSQAKILAKLANRNVKVVFDFVPICEDLDDNVPVCTAHSIIPLFSVWEDAATKYLDCWLDPYPEGGPSFQLCLGDSDGGELGMGKVTTGSSFYRLEPGDRFRVTVEARVDGSFSLKRENLDTGTTIEENSGGAASFYFRGVAATRFYLGAQHDGAGQQLIDIERYEVK